MSLRTVPRRVTTAPAVAATRITPRFHSRVLVVAACFEDNTRHHPRHHRCSLCRISSSHRDNDSPAIEPARVAHAHHGNLRLGRLGSRAGQHPRPERGLHCARYEVFLSCCLFAFLSRQRENWLARRKGRVMGAPEGGGGAVLQWGSCDRTHGKVPIFRHFSHLFTQFRN